MGDEQPVLVEIPEQPPQEPRAVSRGEVKVKSVNRQQTTMAIIDVEELIPADHKARAIRELVGRLDLSLFAEPLRTTEGGAGRPAWDGALAGAGAELQRTDQHGRQAEDHYRSASEPVQ